MSVELRTVKGEKPEETLRTVLDKIETLSNNIGGQNFEEHVRNWLALKHVSSDKLGENIDLVGVHLYRIDISSLLQKGERCWCLRW